MEPVAVGTRVLYHGSNDDMHGVYTVLSSHDMEYVKQIRPDIVSRKGDETDAYLAEKYPDGVSYDLWPEGIPFKFGLRYMALYGARRTSFTVEPEPDTEPMGALPPEAWEKRAATDELAENYEPPPDKFRGDIEL